MFKKRFFPALISMSMLLLMAFAPATRADSFGTGGNQFTIDFVPISGSTNPTVEQTIAETTGGFLAGFGIVNYDYRMGKYEITNEQWDQFKAELGVSVYGNPASAYDESFYDWGTGTTNVPTNMVSWYEAAQMVNWLNTSAGHQAAYKFTGTQGTGDYTFVPWSAAEAAGGTNLYRHKDAYYFLPTEDEWFKAAFWNGTSIQDYATKAPDTLHQGDGTSGTGWNYADTGYATDPPGPWDVGSGSEELNGTYDMMGNVWEWVESPANDPNYGAGSLRSLRGGNWHDYSAYLHAAYRAKDDPAYEFVTFGFRVASVLTLGDANGDGKVDVSDLGILATHYGTSSGAGWGDGDFTGEGAVDVSDLGVLATNYGYGTSVVASIPEPGAITMLLFGLAGLALLRRR